MVDNRFCTPVPSGYVIFSGILTVNKSVEAYFKDKKAWEIEFKVKKDGGELDALTAATISSRAYYDAVARAYEAYKVACGYADKADGVSGATATNNEGQKTQEGGQNE